jgi:hypothetical protein
MTRLVLGLAHLTALELSPPALVTEAARAGFATVGVRVVPATLGAGLSDAGRNRSPPRAQADSGDGRDPRQRYRIHPAYA